MNKLFLLFITSLLMSCGERNKIEAKEKKDYYPIAGYIKNQIAYLDSMPLGILHYRTINNITDSLVIEKPAFNSTVAAEFINSDISSADKMKDYKETPFLDAGTGTMTLVYEAESDRLPVRKIDVLLSIANSDVYTLYVERFVPSSDSSVTQKMLWTNNKNCQVISIINKPGSPEEIIVDHYVWDK